METIPDLAAAGRMLGLANAPEAEVREALGSSFPKHPLHKIACIGALIASRQPEGLAHRCAWRASHWRTTEAHALPPEDILGTNNTPYLAKNQQAVDDELFHDIIPFVETHYNISDEPRERAIAGLSMGGLQSIETGIVHLGYFRWIGAFSPGVRPAALSDEFKNTLKDPNKINENLYLF